VAGRLLNALQVEKRKIRAALPYPTAMVVTPQDWRDYNATTNCLVKVTSR